MSLCTKKANAVLENTICERYAGENLCEKLNVDQVYLISTMTAQKASESNVNHSAVMSWCDFEANRPDGSWGAPAEVAGCRSQSDEWYSNGSG